MFAKMPRLLLMACVICPSLARALGLGEIHLSSALNEPLRAEIDLVAAAPDELTALRASLASRDAFTRYGIDRPAFVSSFSFKVAKSADGRDVLQVRSADAIPEPFVTFLVEVNWARGRLMREYTVLLDPPTYTPGEAAGTAAPVAAAITAAGPTSPAAPSQPAPQMPSATQGASAASRRSGASAPPQSSNPTASSYRTVSGDTLTRIAQHLRGGSPAQVDQTMMAIYRANPDAFDGNINLLRRGAILRIPGADDMAALNQKEAMDEIARQMAAWRGGASAAGGRLRLVTPKPSTGSGASGAAGATGGAAGADATALKNHVKELEAQLAESRRMVDVSNSQLAELQRKLAAANTSVAAAAKTAPPAPAPAPAPVAAPVAAPAPTPAPAAAASAAAASAAEASAASAVPAADKPVVAVTPKPTAPAADQGGSWLDMVLDYWQVPAALFALLFGALGFVAYRRRAGRGGSGDLSDLASPSPIRPDVVTSPARDGSYDVTESFASGDTAEIKAATSPASEPDSPLSAVRPASAGRPLDETMSAESPVSIDQGDPIAEADFHMAYGLYDQAADLVRMAIEREPERRDLRMKLLEIYFVWGNAESFLSTAKELSATRNAAPAGEWDKIMIMGRQICPDEEMFHEAGGALRSPDASIDLNLDGGENHIDIDLFGESSIERAASSAPLAREPGPRDSDSTAETGESPQLSGNSLDFILDAPERGAEPLPRTTATPSDEPTVESEQMLFGGDAATPVNREEHTAEVEIQDLGFDLDQLEATGAPAGVESLEGRDRAASEAPTVISGMDEEQRRSLDAAQPMARDTELTQLERELEASFIAELAASSDDIRGDVANESAPTVNMPSGIEVASTDSTARMEGIGADSMDLDLDLGQFGSEPDGVVDAAGDLPGATGIHQAFDDSQRLQAVDINLGETIAQPVSIPNAMDTIEARQLVVRDSDEDDIPGGEFAPVTMSEVGTKLDLARAYMDMGDPEGARSILEEVVQEGSASQKKEATRLIQSLPG